MKDKASLERVRSEFTRQIIEPLADKNVSVTE